MNKKNTHAEETGVIETDTNSYIVSKSIIKELRRILDKTKSHYILDQVSYHSTEGALALAKSIYNKSVWKVGMDGGVHIDNPFGYSSKFKYEHLVIPSWDWVKTKLENSTSLTAEEKLFIRGLKYR